jgi:cold shock CspA family protein
MSSENLDPAMDAAVAERGVVTRIFAEDGYGFLLTPDCREVRFTRESVLRDEFDELRVGSEVRFTPVEGASGLDADAVDMISAPYPAPEDDPEPLGSDDEVPEMPDTWKDK